MSDATYTTRLGCDNCGHAEIYEFPVRTLITNYDYEERTPSSFRLVNETEEHLINCKTCKLPHLAVLWWKEEEPELVHA